MVIIRWFVVVLWMSVIFMLSSIPSLHVPFAHSYDFLLRKLAHIGEYAILTIAFSWAFEMYTSSRRRAWLLAALAATLYAISDEWHQTWIFGRLGSFKDVGIDTIGIAASYAIAPRQHFEGFSRRVFDHRKDHVQEAMPRMSRYAAASVATPRALGVVLTSHPPGPLPV